MRRATIVVCAKSGTEVPRYHMGKGIAQPVTPRQIPLYRNYLPTGGGKEENAVGGFLPPAPRARLLFFGGNIFFFSLFFSPLLSSALLSLFIFSSLLFSSLRHNVTLKTEVVGKVLRRFRFRFDKGAKTCYNLLDRNRRIPAEIGKE